MKTKDLVFFLIITFPVNVSFKRATEINLISRVIFTHLLLLTICAALPIAESAIVDKYPPCTIFPALR